MLLVLSIVTALYLACLLWFRSLCRSAIRFHEASTRHIRGSNLIPFERGLKKPDQRKRQRAV
jgi:hypothetical protein